MSSHPDYDAPGPFLAAHVRDGDSYELSNGHPIECSPSGPLHSSSNLIGGEVLDTDPDVEWAGIETGYSPDPGELRAADIALDRPPAGDVDGWVPGAPRLAVEYAATGQDEKQLQKKIAEFFAHGTEFVWVVRLLGPRRVEVYAPDGSVEVKAGGEELTAPGILRNPVPVLALFDRAAGHRAVFRNLLQREGYENLDAVRMEGWKEGQARGLAEAILAVLESRLKTVDATSRERILICRDLDLLRRWAIRAANVRRVGDVFAEDPV